MQSSHRLPARKHPHQYLLIDHLDPFMDLFLAEHGNIRQYKRQEQKNDLSFFHGDSFFLILMVINKDYKNAVPITHDSRIKQ